jgi:hypothetical protein
MDRTARVIRRDQQFVPETEKLAARVHPHN